MTKVDLSKNNPFSTYKGDFSSFFSFGEKYDDWVTSLMLESVLANRADKTETLYLADIGAGSCYWPVSFLRRAPNLQITAIDPSKPLILDQARDNLAKSETVDINLERLCMTGQEFSKICSSAKFAHGFDCIYFMQSAHYIGDEEFDAVFTRLADGLRTKHGTVVIQARSMTPEWYPWAFPIEWKENVENALAATSMFGRANSYKAKLSQLNHSFRKVTMKTYEHLVEVEAESYWERLEARWIPTFMAPHIIPDALHRSGIDAMKKRFRANGEAKVSWIEKFSVVTAQV